MSIWGKITGAEGAVKGILDVGKKGMDMWDKSKFTAQEQIDGFKMLIDATKSAATSISRRHLLWALISMMGVLLIAGIYYIETSQAFKLKALIMLATELKIDYAFGGAVGFYYLPHVFSGKKSDEICRNHLHIPSTLFNE